MASKVPFRLALLGGFCLSAGGRTIEVAASGQRLRLLALRDRPAARLYVVGTLWPDYPTGRSLADLRTTLWRLNQSGQPIIDVTHACLGLGDHIDVDVRRLIAFTQRLHAPAARLGEMDLDAVELAELCGELLPDWYEEWLVDERERLRQIRLHALERLSALLSDAGRHSDAIQAALAAIRLEPLRETAHRALIEAHLAEGNWSEARRQFRRCERLLKEELGVEPTTSMRRLLEARPRVAPAGALRSCPRAGLTVPPSRQNSDSDEGLASHRHAHTRSPWPPAGKAAQPQGQTPDRGYSCGNRSGAPWASGGLRQGRPETRQGADRCDEVNFNKMSARPHAVESFDLLDLHYYDLKQTG